MIILEILRGMLTFQRRKRPELQHKPLFYPDAVLAPGDADILAGG
jgi:hypothetical protein